MYILILGLLLSVNLYGMESPSVYRGWRTGMSLQECRKVIQHTDLSLMIKNDIARYYVADIKQAVVSYGTFEYNWLGTAMRIVKVPRNDLIGLVEFLENSNIKPKIAAALAGRVPILGALNPDGSEIAILTTDNILWIFSTTNDIHQYVMRHVTDIPVTCMNYRRSGDLLAVGFDDGIVQLFDVSARDQEEVHLLDRCAIYFGESSIKSLYFDDEKIIIQDAQEQYKQCTFMHIKTVLEEFNALDVFKKLLLCGIYEKYYQQKSCNLTSRALELFVSLPPKLKKIVTHLYDVPQH